MLRLNPSQIQLEKRDLDWHIARHKQRQAASRETGRLTAEASMQSQPLARAHSRKRKSHNAPQRAISALILASRDQYNDGALTSAKPVPRASKAFWDHVLTKAGTPLTASPLAFVNKSQVSSEKETALKLPSERGIYRGVPLFCAEASYDDAASALRPDADTDIAREIARPSKLGSSSSSSATLSDNDSESTSLIPPPDPSSRAMMSRLTSFFQRRAKIDDDVDVEDPLSSHGLDGQTDLDAASQSMGSLRPPIYRTQTHLCNLPIVHKEICGMEANYHPVNDEPYRPRLQTNVSSQRQSQDLSHYEVHRPQHFGLRVSSRVASAFSKSHRTASFQSTTSQTTGLFDSGISSERRQITYRPRSESYSFTASEASAGSFAILRADHDQVQDEELLPTSRIDRLSSAPLAQMTDMKPAPLLITDDDVSQSLPLPVYSTNITFPNRSQRPSHEYFGMSGTGSIDPSAHSSYHETDFATRSSGSPMLAHQSQSDRLLKHGALSLETAHSHESPNWSSLVPSPNLSLSSRTPSAQIRLPPPFSNTPRFFSHSSPPPTTPPISSSKSITPIQSPHTPSSQISLGSHHQYPSSSSPQDLSFVPSAPRTPFTVYNDQIPPYTQPQTPFDLDLFRQRRLQHFPTGQAQNPIYTAPAQLRGSSATTVLPRIRGARARAELMTPTRGPRGGQAARQERNEVENSDAITEEEREWRRLWNGEVGMGREERDRLRRSHGV